MTSVSRTAIALCLVGLLIAVGGAAQEGKSAQALLRAASDTATVDGDLAAAIKQYQAIVDKFGADRAVVASALVQMAECYQKLGAAESRRIYERVVREFTDQVASVTTARARLAMLGSTPPPTAPRATRQAWPGSEVDAMGGPSKRRKISELYQLGDRRSCRPRPPRRHQPPAHVQCPRLGRLRQRRVFDLLARRPSSRVHLVGGRTRSVRAAGDLDGDG